MKTNGKARAAASGSPARADRRRGPRRLGRAGAAILGLALVLLLALAQAAAAIPPRAELLGQDPAARLGGKALVGTDAGDRLTGTPRPDFIAGLSGPDVIRGGKGGDNLSGQGGRDRLFGVRGADTLKGGRGADTLKGGRGADTINGGPGRDRLIGGPGFDYIFDHRGRDLVRTGPGRFVVDVRDGSGDDHVDCKGAFEGIVYADRNDSTSGGCRRRGNRVLNRPAPAPGHVAPIDNQIGQGTNDDPYRPRDTGRSGASCGSHIREPEATPADTCAYFFADRYLDGAWAHEYVPAYRCPDDHPWLVDIHFSDSASAGIPNGVSADSQAERDTGLRMIDISISGRLAGVGDQISPGVWHRYATGTRTGFPYSSATNWIFGGNNWYQIGLYCVTDFKEGQPLGPCIDPNCPPHSSSSSRRRIPTSSASSR